MIDVCFSYLITDITFSKSVGNQSTYHCGLDTSQRIIMGEKLVNISYDEVAEYTCLCINW